MIPFIDLNAQFKRIEDKVIERAVAVLRSGRYINGPELTELEERLADFAGVKHCVCCSSGTDALLMALMAWGIGPGHAVFTSPFTFFATGEVISLLGATPIFVDVDPVTFNIDPAQLEKAIEAVKNNDSSLYPLPPNIDMTSLVAKAVIPVDIFGIPAEYDALNAIAAKYDLLMLEDAAQSFGAEYNGKKTCSLTEVAATSFYPSKPIGAYGDGGAVFTDDDHIKKLLHSVRVHGQGGVDKYDNARLGLNARMDTIQAAMMLPKMDILDDELAARRKFAAKYTELLTPIDGITPPTVPAHCKSAWAQYSVLSDRKAELQAALGKAEIPTAEFYPTPLHMQTAFGYLGYAPEDMPVSFDCSKRIFSLPMHPYMQEGTHERICEVIAATLA
ncbi:MAG: DegT/DnrJ/EryC1/StrS family aminotransferase [Desulfovibrio sp.]|uniref:DegT/DnrJ/EryC1/StrS family aminotransferase n=1 Tax=Desulfovibrio sp. 7SRBS1 TaxID=3378064 RepID=UPI003B3C1265